MPIRIQISIWMRIHIRIWIGIRTMPIHKRILPQVWHIFEKRKNAVFHSNANFSFLTSCKSVIILRTTYWNFLKKGKNTCAWNWYRSGSAGSRSARPWCRFRSGSGKMMRIRSDPDLQLWKKKVEHSRERQSWTKYGSVFIRHVVKRLQTEWSWQAQNVPKLQHAELLQTGFIEKNGIILRLVLCNPRSKELNMSFNVER